MGDSADQAEVARAQDAVKQLTKQEKQLAGDVERGKIAEKTAAAINMLGEVYMQKVDQAVNKLNETELKNNTRLIGSTKTFVDTGLGTSVKKLLIPFAKTNDIMQTIKSNLALSPFVKTEKVINAITEGINKGIVNNVEMRGYLNSVKEGIVETFDAFSDDINKLLRVQQADSTAARMGMETVLMEFYNGMFETSEWLNDGFDSVTSAILKQVQC